MKQTSIEWLEEKAKEFSIDLDLLNYFEQAKEMHKQEIIDVFLSGFNYSAEGYNGELLECDCVSDENVKLESKNYYNETYKK